MSDVDLLPCPFCGTLPRLKRYWYFGWSYYYVECVYLNCPVVPVTDGYDPELDAIKAWNTRSTPPASPAP